jgi:hypothetical protein
MKRNYRESDNIEDMRDATFTDRAMYEYKSKAKAKQPTKQTFKEPMEWQHDDWTDASNARINRLKKNKVEPSTRDEIIRRSLGIGPQRLSADDKPDTMKRKGMGF